MNITQLREEECGKFNWIQNFGLLQSQLQLQLQPQLFYQFEVPYNFQEAPNWISHNHNQLDALQEEVITRGADQEQVITSGDHSNLNLNLMSVQMQSNSSSTGSSSSFNDYDDSNEVFLNLSMDKHVSPHQQQVHLTVVQHDANRSQGQFGSSFKGVKVERSGQVGSNNSGSSRKRKKTPKILDEKQKSGSYQCSQCGRGFSQKGNLQIHYRIHTGERPYKCEEKNCEKAFAQISHLQQHRRLHLDIKPYICTQPGCDDKFRQKSNLDHHLSRKHGLVKKKRVKSEN